jgi:hypothetical protein
MGYGAAITLPDFFIDFNATVVLIASSLSDGQGNLRGLDDIQVLTEEYPWGPLPLLHPPLSWGVQRHIVGYLLDFQLSQIQGNRLESNPLTSPYLRNGLPPAYEEFKLFRSVLAHYVECLLSMEAAAMKFMSMGAIVTHEWGEINQTRKDDTLDICAADHGLRRFQPNTDLSQDDLLQLQRDLEEFEETEREGDAIRCMKDLGNVGIFEIELCRFFDSLWKPFRVSDDITKTRREWRDFRPKQLFDTTWALPKTDDFLELFDRELVKAGSGFGRYYGFCPGISERYLSSRELVDSKLSHRETLAKFEQFQIKVLAIIDSYSKLLMFCQDQMDQKLHKSGRRTGVASFLFIHVVQICRRIIEWNCHHASAMTFLRFIFLMFQFPLNNFESRQAESFFLSYEFKYKDVVQWDQEGPTAERLSVPFSIDWIVQEYQF